MIRPDRAFARSFLLLLCLLGDAGCATARRNAPIKDLQPCADEFVATRDGWRIGVRRYRPEHPDPGKLPVIMAHGLGLNATFWTITDDHLPGQLAARGYEVFVFDMRGSGENDQLGRFDFVNPMLRQTFIRERGERSWTVDDMVRFDVPAILDHVEKVTGRDQVNWIGHSLGGMLIFPYLELGHDTGRIANFVGMGSTIIQADAPHHDIILANRGLRALALVASPGRMGRPLKYIRLPGMGMIDRFYYTVENVELRTISRFYGYALEDTGPGALKQLRPYLEYGHMLSADRRIDYAARLGEVKTPTLMVAGDADLLSDVPSTELTFAAIGSSDKTLWRFGRANGNVADYGHCDLVWSRHAPREIFPPLISWLDERQPGAKPVAVRTAASGVVKH